MTNTSLKTLLNKLTINYREDGELPKFSNDWRSLFAGGLSDIATHAQTTCRH